MSGERRKHGWLFWVAVVAFLSPVLYVASLGPVCWWLMPRRIPRSGDTIVVRYGGGPPRVPPTAPRIYWPLGRLADHGPLPLRTGIRSYIMLGTDVVFVPIEFDGNKTIVIFPE